MNRRFPAQLEELATRRKEAAQRLVDLRYQATARKRATDELLGQRRQAEREATVSAVLPDGGGTAVLAATTEIDTELTRFERAEEEAKAELAAAEKAEYEAIVAELPGLVEGLQKATAEESQALSELARAVLKPYRRLDQAVGARGEAERDLEGMRQRLKSAGGDRAMIQAQADAVRCAVRDTRADPKPLAVLGLLLGRMLAFSRSGSSPLEAWWTDQGIESAGGSVFHHGPISNSEIHELREARLPR